jgi:hypothetical protein
VSGYGHRMLGKVMRKELGKLVVFFLESVLDPLRQLHMFRCALPIFLIPLALCDIEVRYFSVAWITAIP